MSDSSATKCMSHEQPLEPSSWLPSAQSVNRDKRVIISPALPPIATHSVFKEKAAALDTDVAVRPIGIVPPSGKIVTTELVKYLGTIPDKVNGPPTPKRIKLLSSAQWKPLRGKLPYRLVPVQNPSFTRFATIDIPGIKIKEFDSGYIQCRMAMVSPDPSVPPRRVTLISKADSETGKPTLGMYRLVGVLRPGPTELHNTTGTPRTQGDESCNED